MKTLQIAQRLSIIVVFMSLPYRSIAENPTMVPTALGGPQSVRVAPALGAVSEQIPIMVSPGRRAMEPKLILAYSSMGGLDNAGLGWGFEMGRVERWRSDGTPTTGDPDTYLYSIAGSGGELHDTGGKIYRAKIESVYRELAPMDDMDGDGHYDGWIMYNGEGILHRFGGTADSRIPGQVWMLDYVEDKNGNTINYFYDRIDNVLYPREIRYTGYAPTDDPGFNRIVFEYEDRPDRRISYGYQVKQTKSLRLQRISVFAQEALVRRYEFEYEQSPLNNQSLLTRLILVGADDLSKITVRTFDYSERDPIVLNPVTSSIPIDFTDSEGRDTGARISDVNGDGFADIVSNGSDVYLGNGQGGFTRDDTWSHSLQSAAITFVITSGDHKGADAGVRLMDVNADGRPDLFIAQSNRREIWLNTGKNWSKESSEAVQWTSSLNNDIATKADAWVDGYYLGDPNDPNHIAEYNTIWSQEPFAIVESDGDTKGVQLADINGDGRVDILWSLKRTEFLYNHLFRIPVTLRGVYLNTGTGWEKNNLLSQELGKLPDFVVDSQIYGYDVTDINGDGLADILRTFENGQEVFLNTGSGWVKDQAMTDALKSTHILSLNQDRKGQGLMPLDFDDDGLVDYLRADGAHTYAYHNTGNGWQESPEWVDWLNGQGIAFIDADGKATGIMLCDINGDGLSDFVKSKDGQRSLWLSSSMRSGLLTHAVTALGEETEIEWAISTSFDNTDAEGIYGLPNPMTLVTKLIRHDGRGTVFETGYDYSGGLFQERQFRGFAESRQFLPSGLEAQTHYYQEKGLAGQVKLEEAYDTHGQVRMRKSSVYEKHHVNGFNLTQIRLIQTDQEEIDPDGAIHTRVVKNYDDYLNTISVFRDPDVNTADDETTTFFDWIIDTSAGVWSLPAGLYTQDSNGTVLGKSVIFYDGLPAGQVDRCLASQSMEFVEPGNYVSRSMEYDPYGNLIRLMDRDGNMTQFEYDEPYALFRKTAMDAENRVVMSEYDYRFGELVRNMDAGGHVTEKEYDAFGRLTKDILPGDELSPYGTVTYLYSALGDAHNQFYRTLQTEKAGQPGTLDKTTYFDGIAMVYRVEQEGAEGRNIISTTEYDDSGNPVATSRPFFEGDPPLITLIERDERHRPVRVLEPDGIEMTLTYAGPRTDIIDRRGTQTSFYKNADGKTTRVQQWVDGVEQVTRYLYDPLGRMTTVIDASGSETHIAYDGLGRRIRLEDPSAGTYAYAYDGEGHLVEQTAPDGQITRFYYNGAGDLMRKEFPDGATHEFVYGQADRSDAGRVIRMNDAAGTLQIMYDSRGNVIERRRTVLGSTYVTGYLYDSLGRIESMMYPDGFIVYYDYDAGGNLVRVTDRQGRIVTDGIAHTAAGQISQIAYGNGIVSDYAYDDLLRMTSIRTYGNSGSDLQHLNYSYDPGGNILAINDAAWGASQTFDYDEIGRLINAEGSYGSEPYEYDAIGNLLRKGNLVYAMDPEHPQRVVQADYVSNSQSKDPQKNRSFSVDYDENGNVVQKDDISYTYDAENYLVEVRNKTGTVIEKNIYDALGQRVIQWTQNSTTVFIDGIYEQGKTHVSRHVRTDSLLLATVLTSQTRTPLVASVPHQTFMHPGRVEYLKNMCLAMLLGIGVPLGGWSFRKNGWGWHYIMGFGAIACAVRKRPRFSLVALLLIFSVFNNTGPVPVLGVGILNAKPQNETSSEKRFYYHSNHLGSINVVTNEGGQVIERRDYKPYGDPFDWTGPNSGPREFLSSYNGQRYDDATGLYYFGARHYDAELGRFLTADTQVQDPLNPKCLNRYAFGGGNPVRNVDPSGHAWWDWVIGIFVVIAIVVVGVLTAGAAFAAFGLAAAVIAGFTFLGAATFAVIALAQGTSPLSSDFWIAVAAGAVVGAAVGAMLAALPASLGFTGSLTGAAGFFAGLAADVLVGAVLGGLGTVVNHIVKGGGPEDVLKEKLGWEILTSVAKGAIFGLVTGGILNLAGLVGKTGFALAAVLSAALSLEGIWEVSKAGYEPNDKFSFLNIFGTDANWFKNSPLKGLGIPSWAFSGTWIHSGRSEGGYLLQTLPLVP